MIFACNHGNSPLFPFHSANLTSAGGGGGVCVVVLMLFAQPYFTLLARVMALLCIANQHWSFCGWKTEWGCMIGQGVCDSPRGPPLEYQAPWPERPTLGWGMARQLATEEAKPLPLQECPTQTEPLEPSVDDATLLTLLYKCLGGIPLGQPGIADPPKKEPPY